MSRQHMLTMGATAIASRKKKKLRLEDDVRLIGGSGVTVQAKVMPAPPRHSGPPAPPAVKREVKREVARIDPLASKREGMGQKTKERQEAKSSTASENRSEVVRKKRAGQEKMDTSEPAPKTPPKKTPVSETPVDERMSPVVKIPDVVQNVSKMYDKPEKPERRKVEIGGLASKIEERAAARSDKGKEKRTGAVKKLRDFFEAATMPDQPMPQSNVDPLPGGSTNPLNTVRGGPKQREIQPVTGIRTEWRGESSTSAAKKAREEKASKSRVPDQFGDADYTATTKIGDVDAYNEFAYNSPDRPPKSENALDEQDEPSPFVAYSES